MVTRIYQPRNDTMPEKMDIARGNAQQEALEFMLPRIQERNKSALSVVPLEVYFYQKLTQGRRCSCWGVADSPMADCTVCFGQGIVGGFEKYGCQTEVLDVSAQQLSLLNVLPDYSAASSPTRFTLINTATYGEIQGSLTIPQPNKGLNLLWVRMFEDPGNSIELWCKSPSETSYTRLTREAVEARLQSAKLQFIIRMRRTTPEARQPTFEQIRVRVNLIPEDKQVLSVDVPREEQSHLLEDYGVIESFGSINFYFDNTLKRVTTDDFIVLLKNRRRFKPVIVNPNDPAGIILGWDSSCRLIQNYETQYHGVP